MSKVIALVPARSGSRGVPGKNSRLLAGKPLLAYTIEVAVKSARLDRILLSTDSEEIADIGRSSGAEVPFLRPAELAGDAVAMNDVVRHAIVHAGIAPDDIVVLLQPTAPLRNVDDIDQSISLLKAEGFDSVVSLAEVPLHYHPHWQFRIRGQHAEPFMQTGFSQLATRRQDLDTTYTRNGAVYVFYARNLENPGNFYGENVGAWLMPAERSVNIDTMKDWELAEELLKKTT